MNDRESLIARKQEVLRELTRARRQLEAGRSGVEIALELYEEMKAAGISHIYLLPAIRRGGERAYAAAQEFLEEVRKREAP